jgi:hypothetical protein
VKGLPGASREAVLLAYATLDGTATTVDGDYIGTSGTLNFTPGESSTTITVTIAGTTTPEPAESYTFNLSTPVGATIANGTGNALIGLVSGAA